MKFHSLAGAFLLQLFFYYASAANIRAIFLFKDVMKSNTEALKTSGFNTLIIFNIGILENGDIMYYSNTAGSNDTLVASNGSYVGGDALSNKVRSYKTGSNTGIDRVEISTNSQHIRDLMNSPGFGSDTRLYRNFAALKAAWNLDAVNNDDESIYHADSTVAFAQMLSKIGYKYTISPYTYVSFWVGIKNRMNSGLSEPNLLLDRVYLQCYDGGSGNNPASWQSNLGMKVVPLLWVTNDSKSYDGTTAAQAKTKFTSWNSQSKLAGGGYWNEYDIEKMKSSYTEYGSVLTSVFP